MTPPAAGTAANPVARSAAPPLRRPIPPRRVSGPARRRTSVPVQPVGVPSSVLRLVDHALLDRLIRGRVWIALIAFALMSIVAMQVALLRLNRGIGTQIQHAQVLARENSLLEAQVSALGASERIQSLAARHGMVQAPAGEVRYLAIGSSDAPRAASSITIPRATRASKRAGAGGPSAVPPTTSSAAAAAASGSLSNQGGAAPSP